MNTILILDKDAKTGFSEDLKGRILGMLKEKAHRVEVVELERNEVTPCFGCMLCLTKHVRICVTKDRIAEIRNDPNRYDMTIFLTPVIFGHFFKRLGGFLTRQSKPRLYLTSHRAAIHTF